VWSKVWHEGSHIGFVHLELILIGDVAVDVIGVVDETFALLVRDLQTVLRAADQRKPIEHGFAVHFPDKGRTIPPKALGVASDLEPMQKLARDREVPAEIGRHKSRNPRAGGQEEMPGRVGLARPGRHRDPGRRSRKGGDLLAVLQRGAAFGGEMQLATDARLQEQVAADFVQKADLHIANGKLGESASKLVRRAEDLVRDVEVVRRALNVGKEVRDAKADGFIWMPGDRQVPTLHQEGLAGLALDLAPDLIRAQRERRVFRSFADGGARHAGFAGR
jgi:hypothetical protein